MNVESALSVTRTSKEDAALMRRGLVRFAMRVLRPILRFLLLHGLSYPEFNQIIRWLCVDIAMSEKEFYMPGRRRQYKARVAAITGLSRKAVLQLYSSPRPDENDELMSFNRAGRVLQGWLEDERYTDEKGEPQLIPFKAGEGRRSFSALVRKYSGDIPPRAILNELIRAGCCETVMEDEVRVRHPVYVARRIDPQRVDDNALQAARVLNDINLGLMPQGDMPEAASSERTNEESRDIRAVL
jgi:hypothetical protein